LRRTGRVGFNIGGERIKLGAVCNVSHTSTETSYPSAKGTEHQFEREYWQLVVSMTNQEN